MNTINVRNMFDFLSHPLDTQRTIKYWLKITTLKSNKLEVISIVQR